MTGEKKISLKAILLTAVLTAALAFKDAAEKATAALGDVQADDDATKKALVDAQTQLAAANAQLAGAQQHLAEFQDEEALEQHPELVAQMTALGVTDAQVVTPADQLPPAQSSDTSAAPAAPAETGASEPPAGSV